ncbi:SRPBCC family protein [Verticiella sediminum]|uniref:SRPBCC family protein n=1 Tax=Verticiella sediminum TaxID=1247510 RepID=UPI001B877832|nr:SRPBCC family protein [Verticiella sediminum]
MQLEQSFVVDAAPDTVWAAFHDPALLVACLPGASLRGEVEGDQVPLTFKVKLGPIAAAFAGEGRLALDEAARSGSFTGQAIDARSNSRVKGEASFTTRAQEGGTQVGVAVTFTITGSLAQFSREGIVRALGDQLTQQFAANLQARLAGMPTAAPAPAEAAQPELPLEMDTPAETAGTEITAGPAAPSPSASATTLDAATASGPATPPASAAQPAQPGQSAQPGPSAQRPQPADEAPALNLFSLIGAMLRDYWRRLFKKGRAS